MELRAPPQINPPTRPPGRWGFVVLHIALAGAVAAVVIWRTGGAMSAMPDLSDLRATASKLQAAGALDEAATLYDRYLEQTHDDTDRSAMAYSLGNLYLERGQHAKALRWLYDAEAHAPTAENDIGKKIVHTLEAMGRPFAAKAALTSQTRFDTTPTVQRPADDAVVAKIGTDEVHRSDITRALDALPPELAKHFAGAKEQPQFLNKYVADLLLYRKAQKLEYEQDPDVRQKLESVKRQIVVGKFLEKEVLNKVTVNEADLTTYFTANKQSYKERYKAETLDAVRPQVERDYRMMKSEAAYNALVSQELSQEGVKLFADKLAPTP